MHGSGQHATDDGTQNFDFASICVAVRYMFVCPPHMARLPLTYFRGDDKAGRRALSAMPKAPVSVRRKVESMT